MLGERRVVDGWKDFKVVATGDGEKLERWGDYLLIRPDPQVIWRGEKPLLDHKGVHAKFIKKDNKSGDWKIFKPLPDEWIVGYKDLRFSVKMLGNKHVGLFPEQASNWDMMRAIIEKEKRPLNVLNLFAYTGGATVALAKSGAKVTHVDAVKGNNTHARRNAELSGVKTENLRFMVDDCAKFIAREGRRGMRYDAIVMDPPSFGRGPSKELWKIEDHLFDFVKLATTVLSDNPLFMLINSYTTGLQPVVVENILSLAFKGKGGYISSYELCLPTQEGILLPCGCSGLWSKNTQ